MKRICAWCGTGLGTTKEGGDAVSHGICEACCSALLADDADVDGSGFLERFSFPILVVNERLELSDGNMLGLRLAGATRADLTGERLGEVFECEFSRLPGGCGQSVHCQGCSIRKSVELTHETGEPLFDVPSFRDCSLVGRSGHKDLRIHTWKSGSTVLLRIDRL